MSKTFYKNKKPIPAVENLSLEFAEGEFIALLGPSGCGKSTTLRMIAGLESITDGDVYIGERRINKLHPKDRNIGLAFENYALYPPLSVYDNICFNLRAKKVNKAVIKERVHTISNLLGIEDLLTMSPSTLSGGQKQRVNIARALIRKPEVLLLDEPLSHLDGKVRLKMRTEIKSLHEEINCTTIIVTHDQLEAMAVADRIAIINDGKLQQFGTPLEIFNYPVNEFVAGFIGEPPMNFFDVKVIADNGKYVFAVEGQQFKISIPDKYTESIELDQSYRLGIRPTDIKIVNDDHYTVATEVSVYENLGEDCRIHTIFNENSMLSVVSEEIIEFKEGDTVKLLFNAERTHVFSKETGNRIDLDQKRETITVE